MRGFRDRTAGLLQRILGIRARVEVLPPGLPPQDPTSRRGGWWMTATYFASLNRKLEKER